MKGTVFSRKLRFHEEERIGGPGTFQVRFVRFVTLPNMGSLNFIASTQRLLDSKNVEVKAGIFSQANWDLGGSYLGPTRSSKHERSK